MESAGAREGPTLLVILITATPPRGAYLPKDKPANTLSF